MVDKERIIILNEPEWRKKCLIYAAGSAKMNNSIGMLEISFMLSKNYE
jgi:hypothetical protein